MLLNLRKHILASGTKSQEFFEILQVSELQIPEHRPICNHFRHTT